MTHEELNAKRADLDRLLRRQAQLRREMCHAVEEEYIVNERYIRSLAKAIYGEDYPETIF
jgi:hypothetical protein